MEKIHNYPILVGIPYFDANGICTPASWLRLMSYAVEEYLVETGQELTRLEKLYGAVWILLSLTVEIRSKVHPEERLYITAWDVGRFGTVYRKEFAFCREDGEVVAVAASFHALFNQKTRRICKDPSLLEKLELPVKEPILSADSRCELDLAPFSLAGARSVRPSWLDKLGHMNNICYGDLIYDMIEERERKELCRLSRMEFYFLRELCLSDTVQGWVRKQEGLLEFAGVRKSDGTPAFYTRWFLNEADWE